MSKRKANGVDKAPSKENMDVDEESDSDNETSLLNVDFEYFDPSPTIDFHGLKTLLRQLFDVDNQLFDLSELADLILAQPLLGSTIKCDGMESDPYAFLTVLNMHEHRSKPAIQQLARYFVSRSATPQQKELHTLLTSLLDPSAENQVGLILTERFVNMPHQTVPPMYTMLLEEMQWANDEKEPYQFTHYLILSKTYTETESKLDAEDDRPQKKTKKSGSAGGKEVSYFHPEDEVWGKHALATCEFEFEKGEDGTSDSKRAFQELGVRPQGLLVLIEGGKFEGAVKAAGEYLASEAGV